ncbi:MAG TPA: sulfatase [Planctomycetota bacterium]|nr:sulfatase [Planctomycetota bacterium]
MKKLLLLAFLLPAWTQEAPRLNVLFIAVDDLRPSLGCYGDPLVRSPNLDKLASRGLAFNRAYCQQAVCSPSRSSLLTGRRPDTTKVWDLVTHFRAALPDIVTLPQHFKNHGYHAQGFSKIFHGGYDDAPSWSAPHATPKKPGFGPEGQARLKELVEEAKKAGRDPKAVRGLPWEAPDVADDDLADGATAGMAIQALETLKDKPFFLAVGFLRPHLPFVAPKKYWDLYKEESFKPASNPNPPQDAPKYAATTWGELRAYDGIPKTGPLTDAQARKMLHGYHASISYMDAQVGRVLDALDRLGMREKTVVILWGDHGWQLGEHGYWCKHTNYEVAARAPLILSVPGQASAGKRTDALVEFVDIFPSLAEICGLPRSNGVEGTSFKPLLDDPSRPWKKGAISQYPRGIPGQGRCMGYSIRTDRWRLVEWAIPAKGFAEYELYDHQADPGENVNLAGKPEHAATVKELVGLLRSGWKGLAPKEK